MEDLKINVDKLNKSIDDLPEVKRTPDGKIDLEAIATGKNEKGNYIVPDDILKAYYKELPNGTTNESGTFQAWNKGLLQALNDEIRKKGGEALQAELRQRRKMSDTIDIFLKKKASAEEIEKLGLDEGATKQDALIASMLIQAIDRGNIKASTFIRDTAGEKPTDRIEQSVDICTKEELNDFRELLEDIKGDTE